jgi:membrane protease YdiL (CAAX protease family)
VNVRQIIALLMPVLLIAVMYPFFQFLARRFGNQVGWFAGLAVYWLMWGLAYSLLMLGGERLLDLVRPRPLDGKALLLASIPVIFAAIGRFGFGMAYDKPTTWVAAGLIVTAVGNGLFEELLWRGTYLALFPDSFWIPVVWSGLWFALWHYAPGSVSSEGGVVGLMTGAAFFGLFLGLLARQTGTIWWCILSHTLAGIVMVI